MNSKDECTNGTHLLERRREMLLQVADMLSDTLFSFFFYKQWRRDGADGETARTEGRDTKYYTHYKSNRDYPSDGIPPLATSTSQAGAYCSVIICLFTPSLGGWSDGWHGPSGRLRLLWRRLRSPRHHPIRSQWHTSLTLNELARMSEPRVTTYEQVLTTTS